MYENLVKLTESVSIRTVDKNDSARYSFTSDFEQDKAYDLIKQFVDLAKVKGLTIRQAQQLFLACSDYVMDAELK